MSSGSTLPPVGGFAELGISYSTLQSTCSGTLKSLTRYAEDPAAAAAAVAPDAEPLEDLGPEPTDAAAAEAAATAATKADGTPAAIAAPGLLGWYGDGS